MLATFVDPNKFPYRESQLLGIAEYRIMDAEGNVVQEGATDESTPVVNGQVSIILELSDIEAGSYKLVVNSFVSEKKADQPLNISGTWECEFSK